MWVTSIVQVRCEGPVGIGRVLWAPCAITSLNLIGRMSVESRHCCRGYCCCHFFDMGKLSMEAHYGLLDLGRLQVLLCNVTGAANATTIHVSIFWVLSIMGFSFMLV